MAFWDLNSGLHSYRASTLIPEASPPPLLCLLKNILFTLLLFMFYVCACTGSYTSYVCGCWQRPEDVFGALGTGIYKQFVSRPMLSAKNPGPLQRQRTLLIDELSLRSPPPCILRQALSKASSSPEEAGMVATEPQESACICPNPGTVILCPYRHAQLCKCGFWGLHSGPCTGGAGMWAVSPTLF